MSTTTTTPPAIVRDVDGRQVPAAGEWAVDKSHATVEFVARHLMVSKVRGRFTDYDAKLVIAERPEDSSLEVELQAASLTTGEEARDGHLHNEDFLDVEQYPLVTFKSTSIEPVSDDTWKVTGDFTIRDTTRPLDLEVTFGGAATTPWNTQAAFFSANAEFDREDWGLTWNQPLAGGGVLVGKKVQIEIDVELNPVNPAS
jgi:polyisoprenoid-binding protein YceI